MNEQQKRIDEQIIELYKSIIFQKHPEIFTAWPVLSGHNAKTATYKDWLVIIFEHTGNPVMTSFSFIGNLSQSIIGAPQINESNKMSVKSRLERHYHLKLTDAIVLVNSYRSLGDEICLMLQKHEYTMGLIPMKIFLSHKGADKNIVREYKKTLLKLGFDPWLDEDAMAAGVELERGILQGFQDSCAAIFFITPNFKDEGYLATEVDYAIAEKRKKASNFAIITLVFNQNGQKGSVPDLLHRYVWKEPKSDLEALREIVRALPVVVGNVYWKQP